MVWRLIYKSLGVNGLAGWVILSIPALPPYKDTKNNPHFLVMWITIYLAVWTFFRTFVPEYLPI